MWESIQYVNNKWALYAVIAISVLLILKSWLNKTERVIDKLPENERSSIVKLEILGNFLFKILFLFILVVGAISIFPMLQNKIDSKIIEIEKPKEKIDYKVNKPIKLTCPEKYSDNPNANVDCLFEVR